MNAKRLTRLVLATVAVAVAFSTALPGPPALADAPAWVRRFPEPCGCGAASVGPNNVYVGGVTDRSIAGQPFVGGTDAVVRGLDPEGDLLWTREFGTSQNDAVTALVADGSGVYAVGYQNALAKGGNNPPVDAFVKKFDPSGTLLWTQIIATPKQDEADGVALDASGGVFVTGTTHDTLPGETSAGRADVFVEHLSSDGAVLWAHQFGTARGDFGDVITIGTRGAIYLAGSTYGVFPGMTKKGGFIARLDPTATTLRWVRGRIGARLARGITVADGGIYVTFSGGFNNVLRRYAPDGSLDWGRPLQRLVLAYGLIPRNGAVVLGGWTPTPFAGRTGLGGTDVFLRSYAADGSVRWTNEFGTSSDDYGSAIAGSVGATYMTGASSGTWPTADVVGHGQGFLART